MYIASKEFKKAYENFKNTKRPPYECVNPLILSKATDEAFYELRTIPVFSETTPINLGSVMYDDTFIEYRNRPASSIYDVYFQVLKDLDLNLE